MSGVQVSVAGGIGRITLDNPPVNVLTRGVLAELRGALERLAADETLCVLLLLAEGKHFSAGADVAEHLPPVFEEMIPEFVETVRALDAFPVPVIAAVQGRCLGGGLELVLAADIVVAAEGATFGQPEIGLAVIPPIACAWLPTRTGRGVAADLVFTGDALDARTAERAGLVRRVVPDAELADDAGALAARIARHSAAALRLAKRALRFGQDAPGEALAAAGALYVNDLMATADAREGLAAFVEKRPPTWVHR